ncbi:MAG: hypothetical protein KF852_08370 [Saprospiraceae bacterium]|nr:hypothetical protein [Saprospiraceae bacterium]
MPKQKTDDLVQLIRSLTQAEKRHFRLFATRNQGAEDMLFLQLFDVLDKKGEYEEAVVLKKISALKKEQLPNLKAHLYRQLLTSLRLLSKNRSEDIALRESIDYARVLYDKGLYRPGLEILAKAKERALAGQFKAIALEIIEFEKLIEGQYITRSIEGRARELALQSAALNREIALTHQFSNLSLEMYGLYLQIGFARNREDHERVKAFFHHRLPDTAFDDLDFLGQIFYCQAHVWLYHICQEFAQCYRHAQKWVYLFDAAPAMQALHSALYLKGIHNLLSALFNSLHDRRFEAVWHQLNAFPERVDFSHNRNLEGLFLLYRHIHLINLHYLQGDYAQGVGIIPALQELLSRNPYNWDQNRILQFHYRIACLHFGNGDYGPAIDFLNKIINQKAGDYRNDIHCFARILNLIAHYELGNMDLVEHLAKSVYRFLLHIEDLQRVQRELLLFIRRVHGKPTAGLAAEFAALHEKLSAVMNDPFERRPFMYLDILSWLEAKLRGASIQHIIREKRDRRLLSRQ